jgi:hypothetical protein
VSDGTGDWEYAYGSVRDMACFGFLSSRLALIVIVFADGLLAPATA